MRPTPRLVAVPFNNPLLDRPDVREQDETAARRIRDHPVGIVCSGPSPLGDSKSLRGSFLCPYNATRPERLALNNAHSDLRFGSLVSIPPRFVRWFGHAVKQAG